MRTVLIAATILTASLLAMPPFASAQERGRDTCATLCDCNALNCRDYCNISSCGYTYSVCRRAFDRMVRDCRRTCEQCQSLRRRKRD